MTGFTRFDNLLLEKMLTSRLTQRQLKILLFILRFAAGYQKTYAVLRKRDFAVAGLSASCIGAELRRLVNALVIRSDPRRHLFWINERVDDWHVRPVRRSARELARIGAKNLFGPRLSHPEAGRLSDPKTGSALLKERSREGTEKDIQSFERVRSEYVLHVAPLRPGEPDVLRHVVEAIGEQGALEAIEAVKVIEGRSFSRFLSTVDQLATGTRHERMRRTTPVPHRGASPPVPGDSLGRPPDAGT